MFHGGRSNLRIGVHPAMARKPSHQFPFALVNVVPVDLGG